MVSDNPYEAPRELDQPAGGGDPQMVRRIATRQRYPNAT